MIKCNICLFFLFLNITIFGNNAYFRLINEAELKICNDSLEEALSLYQSAFKLTKVDFAFDYYNASICALKLGKYEKSIDYCEKLVRLGCPMNFFIQKDAYKILKRTNYWQKFIANYNKNFNAFIKKTNWKKRALFEQWKERDQSIYRLRGIISKDSIKKISIILSEELKPFFDKNKYPTDNEIGVFITSDTIISQSPIHVIFRHFYQQKIYTFNSFLEEAVKKGRLRPEELMSYQEFYFQSQKKAGYGIEPYICINKSVYFNNNANRIEEINQNRQNISGETFSEYCKKIEFQEFNVIKPSFVLTHFGALAIIDGLSKEDEQRLTVSLVKTNFTKK